MFRSWAWKRRMRRMRETRDRLQVMTRSRKSTRPRRQSPRCSDRSSPKPTSTSTGATTLPLASSSATARSIRGNIGSDRKLSTDNFVIRPRLEGHTSLIGMSIDLGYEIAKPLARPAGALEPLSGAVGVQCGLWPPWESIPARGTYFPRFSVEASARGTPVTGPPLIVTRSM